MRLPADDVFVGETFDAAVEWLLAREVESYEFVVPLFELDGAVVEAAPGTGRKVPFTAGAGEVSLPLERGEEVVGGRQYTRFAFPARITLARSGAFDLEPVRVAARLQTGEERDRFGFRRPRYELFRAEGRPRRLTGACPARGRPAGELRQRHRPRLLDRRRRKPHHRVGGRPPSSSRSGCAAMRRSRA